MYKSFNLNFQQEFSKEFLGEVKEFSKKFFAGMSYNLFVPDMLVDNILRSLLFPEMANTATHNLADHFQIGERFFGNPFTEVNQYIDAPVKELAGNHRILNHDLIIDPLKISFVYGPDDAIGAIGSHYLPDSTTPAGISF